MTTQEVTLSADEIRELTRQAEYSGLNFTNRANRDAVYREAKSNGLTLKRGSIRGQLLDPRYTVEGRNIPDAGLGNDYRHFHAVLYSLDYRRF